MENSKDLKEIYKRRAKKNIYVLGILFVLIIGLAIASLSLGGNANLKDVVKIINNFFGEHSTVSNLSRIVILKLRLPRVIMGILVGVALAISGLLMQGIFQNPLVSPYTLGISSGASFGAAFCIIIGANLGFLGQYALPIYAFIFSLITIIIVYIVWTVTGKNHANIVLIGLAVGYLFSALLSFLQYTGSRTALPKITFWMMGSIANISWTAVIIMAIIDILLIIVVILKAWDLNIMMYGRDVAISLGVDYDKLRIVVIVVATILTATSVAFTGTIGFVGLMAPQMTRRILSSDYRYMTIGAALVGGLLVLVSDTIARTIMYPVDLPIGIITSFVGVPFFLYLIIKGKK